MLPPLLLCQFGHCHGDKMSVGSWPCTGRNKTSVFPTQMCSPAEPSYGVHSKRWEMCEILPGYEESDFWYLVCADLIFISTAGPVISTYSLRGHVSYAYAEVLPLSLYRPSPVSIENYCESEELLDLVFIADKVLFTLVN